MTALDIANEYANLRVKGWGGFNKPDFVREQFNLVSASVRPSFSVTRTKTFHRPEYFSLHRIARKAIKKDVGGTVQEVGDCVSQGAKHATEYLMCSDIILRKEREQFRPVFAPYYYGTGRVYVGKGRLGNEDGSLGSWMAEAVMKYGTLFSDEQGVPAYSGRVARAWGDPNPAPDLDKWKATASKYLVRSAARVNNWDELCEAIANGYPCTIASDQGFDMEPSRSGYHEANGNWAHQMCVTGFGPDYALITNSWGDVHGRIRDFHEDDVLPVGTIRARKNVVQRMIAQNETFAFSMFDGFPAQDEVLQKALFDLIGED